MWAAVRKPFLENFPNLWFQENTLFQTINYVSDLLYLSLFLRPWNYHILNLVLFEILSVKVRNYPSISLSAILFNQFAYSVQNWQKMAQTHKMGSRAIFVGCSHFLRRICNHVWKLGKLCKNSSSTFFDMLLIET